VPYYVNTVELQVEVVAPGKPAPPNCQPIDGDVLEAYADLFKHGMPVTDVLARALINGEGATIELMLPEAADRRAAQGTAVATPMLPRVGRWEYKVVAVRDILGGSTAKAVAERMQTILNDAASSGWELVTASERDSRFLVGGETVMLTLRRYVVTEAEFAARVHAEERIRRSVLAEMDDPTGITT
jgi:Domain of unknown function (DUF4177)